MDCRNDFRCYLCGGNTKQPVIETGGYRVSSCTICGLGFLDSEGTPEHPRISYGEAFYAENRMIKEPACAVRDSLPKVRFVQKVKNSGNLLDVGCGLGYFLAAARSRGFSVYGIEHSEWALDYIKKQFDITAFSGPIENLKIDDGSFDMVTMWQVIEHLPDPLGTLKKIRDILRDDGVVIIETRNYRSFDAKVLKEKWNGWSLPYHLWHFDLSSLVRTIEKVGFTPIRLKTNYSDYVKKKMKGIPFLSMLRNPISALFAGSNLTVIAGKR